MEVTQMIRTAWREQHNIPLKNKCAWEAENFSAGTERSLRKDEKRFFILFTVALCPRAAPAPSQSVSIVNKECVICNNENSSEANYFYNRKRRDCYLLKIHIDKPNYQRFVITSTFCGVWRALPNCSQFVTRIC